MRKAWWKEAIIYQIYPRSFKDSNGDGIGDLKGITSRLDYLKDLGIDVIWLSPVYKSPNADNGYDISDYRDIMDEFGTMADFDELLAEAHKRNIKIVMDLVVNHTSDEHEWFIQSRKSKDNPYRDYYIWREAKPDGGMPNNWGSCFSGPAWKYDVETDMYYLHLFADKQPDLNWENEKVRDEVFNMMTWWCDKGIDGFRMDVISMISKVEGLPDGPVGENSFYGDFAPYSIHGPKVHDYLKEMNEKVLSKYDLLTVGETAGATYEHALKYAGEDSHELNMVFTFEHVSIGNEENKWNTKRTPLVPFKDVISRWQTNLHGKAWNSIYIENHDQPRSVSRFGNDSEEYRAVSAKMLAVCMYMLEGTPYIYQGQELGMTNYPFTCIEEFRDVENINAYRELVIESRTRENDELIECFRFKSRDNARTPMQWDDSENAGFTTGIPWINVNPNYKTINVLAEEKDSGSVLNFYKKLIKLRKSSETIMYGSYELLLPEDENIFAYVRKGEGEEILVVCNFTDKKREFEFENGFKNGEVLISNCERMDLTAFNGLKPYEAVVIKKRV